MLRCATILRCAVRVSIATRNLFPREYFYWLSDQGRLYHLYDVEAFLDKPENPPHGPSYIKDPKLLDFFFNDLLVTEDLVEKKRRRLGDREKKRAGATADTLAKYSADTSVLSPEDMALIKLFPYVSRCANEVNFLAVQRAPLVFHGIEVNRPPTGATVGHLLYGGRRKHPFHPAALRVDKHGYVYHPIDREAFPFLRWAGVTGRLEVAPGVSRPERSAAPDAHSPQQCYGIVDSAVGMTLGLEYVCTEQNPNGEWEIEWHGAKSPIKPF